MEIKYLNPCFDVPFKHLLANDVFARGLISIIIGREVVELTSKPQEKTSVEIAPMKLIIYRKDYRAKIKTIKNGEEIIETVKIEMQKSKIAPHIDRFREYTGAEYSTPDEIIKTKKKNGKEKTDKIYYPIITIYFIEKTFNPSLPSVLKIGKEYKDVLHNKPYKGEKDEIVELLTHEAYFIQLEKLPSHLQEKYEVLQIFRGETSEDEIIMTIETDKNIYTEKTLFGLALFILASVAGDRKMRNEMDEQRKFEQTYQDNLDKDIIIEQQDNELKQNQQQLEQNKEQLEQNKEQLEQKEKALINSAIMMKQAGIPTKQIIETLGLTKQDIENL
jgi:hypothetical protein